MIPSSAVNCEFLTGIPRIKASDAIEDMYPRDSEIYIICDCKVTASKPQPLPTDAVAKIAGDGDVPKAVEKSIENFVLYYYNTDGRKVNTVISLCSVVVL